MTEIGMDYFDAQIGCYCFPIGLDERIRVAGYEVKYLYLYFVFLPGEDGILIKDAEHTAFCFAEYVFEPSDRDAAYVDLVAKLTSIYGDVDVYKIEKPFKTESAANLMYVETNLWYGAEDTMVSVVRMDHQEVDYHKIKIKYGFMGADGLAENAYAAAMKEEKENAVSNIDGL